MADSIDQKSWAVMQDEDVLYEHDSKLRVLEWCWREGYTKDDVDLLAMPKPHGSMIV